MSLASTCVHFLHVTGRLRTKKKMISTEKTGLEGIPTNSLLFHLTCHKRFVSGCVSYSPGRRRGSWYLKDGVNCQTDSTCTYFLIGEYWSSIFAASFPLLTLLSYKKVSKYKIIRHSYVGCAQKLTVANPGFFGGGKEGGRVCLTKINKIWYDMIYLLTAIGLSPGGSNTHLHTNNT